MEVASTFQDFKKKTVQWIVELYVILMQKQAKNDIWNKPVQWTHPETMCNKSVD